MASKGKSPTSTNADISPLPTTPTPYADRVNEEIQALWSLLTQPGGILINGDHIVSQENADVAQTGVTSTTDYATDQWAVTCAGAVVVTHQRITSLGLPGFTYALRTQITTIDNALAAGDNLAVFQPVEGFRMAGLGFGGSGARRLLAGFWVRSSVTGTFGFSLRNAANNRAYVKTFSIASANTWEFKVIEIPGDITGTWVGAVNTLGMTAAICLSAGSTFQGTDATWNAANNLTTSAQTNLSATLNATFDFTGVQLFQADAANLFDTALSPRWSAMFRPLQVEIELCKRYFKRESPAGSGLFFMRGGAWYSTTTGLLVQVLTPPMRVQPTMAVSSAAHFSALTAGGGAQVLSTISITSGDPLAVRLEVTVASGVVAGNSMVLHTSNAAATLDFSARM